MKLPIYLVCTLLLFCSCASNISLREELLVAEVKENNIIFKVNKREFINEANKEFFSGIDIIDSFDIISSHTIGNEKVHYYYLVLSSTTKDVRIARWLFERDGKLYMENSADDTLGYTYFFVKCEGTSPCEPSLVNGNSGFFWICGEEIFECSMDETKCTKTLKLL